MLSRRSILISVLILTTIPLFALSRVEITSELGGKQVCLSGSGPTCSGGVLSTTRVQQSFPLATYSVYLSGTSTLATIYSDPSSTSKGNPSSTDANAFAFFYIAPGSYTITFSGGGIAIPFSRSITIPSTASTVIGYSVLDYGAICDNVTDDTAAIQATINVAGPHRVLIPPLTCKITSTLTVAQDRVWIVGQGKQVSKLHFVSAVNGAPALAFSKSTATLINQCGVRDLTIFTDSSAGIQKVGIRITDASEFTVTQVAMYPFTSNANSIGIQYRGREFFYLDHTEISADQPISVERNPNTIAGPIFVDIDHAHWSDLYLLTQANLPAIKFADGVHVTNFISDGTNSCTGGSDCIYNVDTTTTGTDGNAVISGWRWEQPASAGRFLTWSRNQLFRGLSVRSNLWGAGTTMNGILLRNIEAPTISGNSYLGTLTFMDVDATVRNLHMQGNFVKGGAVNSLAGQQAIFKINKGIDSTAPDYVDTWYDTTSNTNVTQSGKMTSIGGLNEYGTPAIVTVPAGIANRVLIPLGSGGQAVGYIEVACHGTTLTEGGTAIISSIGASAAAKSANFDVGNVAGKITVFWEAAFQITLANQTAEDMTCGYRHWWF